MANDISLSKIYVPLLQEAWEKDSLTARLENTPFASVMAGAQADEVKVPELSMDGLTDYSRVNGYTAGNIQLVYHTRSLSMDRGIKFNLDVMDDFESMKIVAGRTMSAFQRDHVVPEIDAYRFSKIAKGANSANRANGSLDKDSVMGAFDSAQDALNEANVPEEGRILYCTSAIYNALKQATTRMVMNRDEVIGRDVASIDGVTIIKVPSNRFYVGWRKKAGGGYENEGSKLNFILLHPSAVCPVVKHGVIRSWTPEQNQSADGYQFAQRIYHDLFIMPLKDKGIYIHTVEAYAENTLLAPIITDKTGGKFTIAMPTGSVTGTTIKYTTDGSAPTAGSSTYSAEVTSTSGAVIKAYATKTGYIDSPVGTVTLA